MPLDLHVSSDSSPWYVSSNSPVSRRLLITVCTSDDSDHTHTCRDDKPRQIETRDRNLVKKWYEAKQRRDPDGDDISIVTSGDEMYVHVVICFVVDVMADRSSLPVGSPKTTQGTSTMLLPRSGSRTAAGSEVPGRRRTLSACPVSYHVAPTQLNSLPTAIPLSFRLRKMPPPFWIMSKPA